MDKSALLLLKSRTINISIRSVNTRPQQSPFKYCMDLVRTHDYENFLCSLLLSKDIQRAAIAIRAFNVEIALVQDHAHDVAIGGMRYNFWKESLKKIYSDAPPQAPVPLELHRVLQTHKLSKHYFQRLLDARWKKWQSSIFQNMDALEQYAEDTVSPIYYLLLEAKNIKNVHADHVASHLGKAQGIVTLIRSVPYHAQRRSLVLPQDLLMHHGVSSESVFRGESTKEFTDVLFQVASRANQHLDKARTLKQELKQDVSHIFLPAANVERYLKKLEKVDFNIYSPRLRKKGNMLPVQLLWAKYFSKW